MRNWSYGINAYTKTAHVNLETAPWYIFFILWLFDGPLACHWIPPIPFPDIWKRKRNRFDDCPLCKDKEVHCEDHESLYTLKEWYGNLPQAYHVSTCGRIIPWGYSKIHIHNIPMSYDEAKKLFPEDAKFFEEHEKSCEKIDI